MTRKATILKSEEWEFMKENLHRLATVYLHLGCPEEAIPILALILDIDRRLKV